MVRVINCSGIEGYAYSANDGPDGVSYPQPSPSQLPPRKEKDIALPCNLDIDGELDNTITDF